MFLFGFWYTDKGKTWWAIGLGVQKTIWDQHGVSRSIFDTRLKHFKTVSWQCTRHECVCNYLRNLVGFNLPPPVVNPDFGDKLPEQVSHKVMYESFWLYIPLVVIFPNAPHVKWFIEIWWVESLIATLKLPIQVLCTKAHVELLRSILSGEGQDSQFSPRVVAQETGHIQNLRHKGWTWTRLGPEKMMGPIHMNNFMVLGLRGSIDSTHGFLLLMQTILGPLRPGHQPPPSNLSCCCAWPHLPCWCHRRHLRMGTIITALYKDPGNMGELVWEDVGTQQPPKK